jgi:annexin A7/11
MEDALLFQLRNGVDKYMHQATLLEDAMAGAGTKDYLLVSRIVRFRMFTTPPFFFLVESVTDNFSLPDWDRNHMANVRGAYEKRYHRNLASRIKGETSGDYERLMLACIGERV